MRKLLRTKMAMVWCGHLLVLGCCLFGTSAPALAGDAGSRNTQPASQATIPVGFVRAQGDHLVVSGSDEEFYLRGINLINNYYGGSWEEIVQHPGHNEADYARIKALGMNCVRLNLNGEWLEDPAKPGSIRATALSMLDSNIEWARQHGIYLILDMHVPVGGDWLDSSNPEQDFRIWDDPSVRSRFLNMWKALAARYRNESTIAAYDLLNEPLTSDQTGQSWRDLAQECADTVRSVDPNHLLIVERVYGCNGEWELSAGNSGQFLIDDSNVLYDFHFYEPMEYTHQGASWVGMEDSDGGRYPDPSIAICPDNAEWLKMIESDPTLPAGDSPWKYYPGQLYRPGGNDVLLGSPVLAAANCEGRAWFDSIEIREYDENRLYLRTLRHDDINAGSIWYSYSEDGSGRFEIDFSSGQGDGTALTIGQTGSDANWNNTGLAFPIANNHYYQINGWMKGADISEDAWACLSIEFYRLPPGEPLVVRNRQFLESRLDKWMAFGRVNQVPISCMEFGLMKNCFAKGKGGSLWVGDMLDIMIENKVSFAYWCYHAEDMGLYLSTMEEPVKDEDGNQGLITVFTAKLLPPVVAISPH